MSERLLPQIETAAEREEQEATEVMSEQLPEVAVGDERPAVALIALVVFAALRVHRPTQIPPMVGELPHQ